jgi:hypothetical protein
MNQPIASVAVVAKSVAQAKVFVALLRAEGIPANLEGDSLTDEIAITRQMMNLNGTRVMVPTNSLEQARELLANIAVDQDELERQALTAADPESAPLPSVSGNRSSRVPLVLTTSAAVTLGVLWMGELSNRLTPSHPILRLDRNPGLWREYRHSDNQLHAEYFDHDHDGAFEQIRTYGNEDQRVIAYDDNRDGRFEKVIEQRRQGFTSSWEDTTRDGMLDRCTITNHEGKVLQVLRWQDGTGFVVDQR